MNDSGCLGTPNMAKGNEISRRDGLTLAQAVKATGLAETGGQAKLVIREGMVLVNGTVETRPGAQLAVGDTIAMGAEAPWRVVE